MVAAEVRHGTELDDHEYPARIRQDTADGRRGSSHGDEGRRSRGGGALVGVGPERTEDESGLSRQIDKDDVLRLEQGKQDGASPTHEPPVLQ